MTQREEVVLSLLRKEEPMAALSRRYQVSEQTLYRWRDEFLAGGRARLGKGDCEAEAAQRRITKLEQELARRARSASCRSAKDIFKKTSGVPRLSAELRAR